MNRTSLYFLILSWSVFFVYVPSTWAGQVVTDETIKWARAAIKQEKSLKTAAAPNTVAVMYFKNKTGNPAFDSLQKGLALMLISDLSKVKEIQVLERVKIQALVEELDLGKSGLVDRGKGPRVGRLLGVANLVGGDILQLNEQTSQLKAHLLKVSIESIFGQPSAEGELLEGFFVMEKELLFNIIRYFKIALTAEMKVDLNERLTKSLQALLHFFEGIYHSDLTDYAKARKSYVKALKEDPNFELARAAIHELDTLDEEQCNALRNRLLDSLRR